MKKGTLKKILNQCVVCNTIAKGVLLNVNRYTAVNPITLTIRPTPPNYP
jgi:hypothetical protein